ncbi:MAG: hypothetical protein JSW64_15830 [Candidatus Zixiibacteriota bacterium]|nr:MAG: hypothetical protein JSW64_15830 [candidate division Zixibacteria bacterium]
MSGSRSSSSGRSSSGTSGRKKSKKKLPDIWAFIIGFVIFFTVAFLIWDTSKPIGAKIFAFCGEQVVKLLEKKDTTRNVITQGGDIFIIYHPSSDGKSLSTKFKYYTFNGVFLFALIMAVPGINYKLRLKILIIGFILIFPFQLLLFVVFVLNSYAKRMMIRDGFLYPDLIRHTLSYGQKILIRVEGQLIPIIIWGGLFYYYKWHGILTKRIKSR